MVQLVHAGRTGRKQTDTALCKATRDGDRWATLPAATTVLVLRKDSKDVTEEEEEEAEEGRALTLPAHISNKGDAE